MATAVKAVYENGVFKPEEPVALQDKTNVRLIIQTAPEPAREDDDPTGWKTADEPIGFTKDGPKGSVGEEHERYLYRK